ncbi:MAG: hemolysin family protein [Oscillospiraceae bacterium]|nr:hemolysin family protein [Oscillospiraceae bacterium]
MDSTAVSILTIIILIALSAAFSSMETAISSASKIRLKHNAANGDKKSARALRLAENFNKTITTILIGNNIVNILLSSLGTVFFTKLFGASGVAISTVVITILVLIFGEILPKSIAKQNSEKLALASSGILSGVCWLFTPISVIFMQLQKAASHLFRSNTDSPSVTEDELKYIIEEIEDEGVLEEKESDLVRSALEFDDTTAKEILIPRVKVVAVEASDDTDKILQLFLNERYTRLPVYENSIDNVIGFITDKDFFAMLYTSGDNHPPTVERIIQKAIYISESKLISEVLYEMQRSKIHMAIVKDEYGGTSGIITMEDIIEELVGEIYDENDEVIQSIVKVGTNMYEIMADLSLSDMIFRLELPDNIIESESNTVGGWTTELFGCIPEKGSVTKNGIFTVTVLDSDDRSVGKIGLKIDMPELGNSEQG